MINKFSLKYTIINYSKLNVCKSVDLCTDTSFDEFFEIVYLKKEILSIHTMHKIKIYNLD